MSQNQQLEGEISAVGPLGAELGSVDIGTHDGAIDQANHSGSADPPSAGIPIISNSTTDTTLPPVIGSVPNTPEPLFRQLVKEPIEHH